MLSHAPLGRVFGYIFLFRRKGRNKKDAAAAPHALRYQQDLDHYFKGHESLKSFNFFKQAMKLYSKILGTGKPLIILHGFLGMSDNWKTLGTKYAENGFEVHLLDLRNHGRSPHSSNTSYKSMALDIYDYCMEHNLKSVDIIGHSMGGKVAMLFATTYSDLVDKLIVADIAPKYYKPHHDEILKGLSSIDFAQKPSREDADEQLAKFVPDLGTRQFLLKNLYWKQPEQLGLRFNLEAFLANKDSVGVDDLYGKIFNRPTLFIRGGNSNYILDSDFPAIVSHFPKAKILTIDGVGHWLHAENPQDFLEISLEFLQ